jgi:hypothetical protein
VYVGIGGLEPRPDILAKLRKAFDNVGYVMAGRDTTIMMNGMMAQAKAMKAISDGGF